MPQLDTTTFLIQYSWIFLVLPSLFIVVTLFIIPKLKSNFKIRSSIKKELEIKQNKKTLNTIPKILWL